MQRADELRRSEESKNGSRPKIYTLVYKSSFRDFSSFLCLERGRTFDIFINVSKYFYYRGFEMPSKSVTLKVDSKVYDEYRKFCKEKGLIVSKQFENFIKEELKKNKIKV